MSNIWLIRSTFPNKEEAVIAARGLLESRLVACTNINESSTAMYHWEDMIQQEQEVVLLAKTTPANVQKTIARIKELHSYQVPSILAWEVGSADATFAQWVTDVTGS